MLDHAGKVRKLDGSEGDAARIEAWREGVTALAKLPHVRVKLSMLGFLVPGWTEDAEKEAVVVGLVKELLELFGPSRCMFASNWHGSGASSNADYCDECQPTMTELYERFQGWCDGPLGLDAEAQAMVFALPEQARRGVCGLRRADAHVAGSGEPRFKESRVRYHRLSRLYGNGRRGDCCQSVEAEAFGTGRHGYLGRGSFEACECAGLGERAGRRRVGPAYCC